MGGKEESKAVQINEPVFKLKFNVFAPITVSLPAVSLLVCFVSAMIFQFDEVNFTMCKVNILLIQLKNIPATSCRDGARL